MNDPCASIREIASAFVDNELSATESLGVENHLRQCGECAAEVAALRALSAQIKQHAHYQSPDPTLSERVLAQIQTSENFVKPPEPMRRRPRRNWLQLGGMMAAALLLTTSLNWYWNLRQSAARLRQEIVGSHIRSLLSQRPFDVASSDRHTVKPWFNGKIDFAPPVLDLSAQGYPLLGGRLDYLDQQTVAVVVYGRRKHVINLYLRREPGTGNAAPRLNQTSGYSLIEWQNGGMRLTAVSDLAASELLEFARLYGEAR